MDASRFFSILVSFAAAGMLAVVLAVTLGCNQKTPGDFPHSLQGVSPQQVEKLGELYFFRDVADGYEQASQRGLPCLLFFTADWCTYCHQMEETAFRDPTIKSLAEQFVCIKVDAERYSKVCAEFEVTGFPTIQFLAPDGRDLHRLVGRQSAGSLATGMRAATQRFAWLNGNLSAVR